MVAAARILALGVALAGSLAAVAPARADPEPPALVEARAHFQQGKAFLDAKVYDKAIEEFEAAYKLSPFPELVFNVAQAYRLADQPDKAIAAYQEYLKSTPTGELADESRVHVAELTKLVDERRAEAAAATAAAQQQAAAAQQRATAAQAQQHQRAAAEHAAAQARYDAARTHYDGVLHNRHVGDVVLIVGGLAIAGGIALVIPNPASTGGAIGFTTIVAGLTTVLIGGVIAAGNNPGAPPAAPPPLALGAPPVHAIGWTFAF